MGSWQELWEGEQGEDYQPAQPSLGEEVPSPRQHMWALVIALLMLCGLRQVAEPPLNLAFL